MTRLPAALLGLLVSVGLCGAQEPQVEVVDTELRSLGDCPRKHVITSAEAFARVVSGLEGAPDAPDFSTHHVALVVFDRGTTGDVELGEPQVVEGVLRVPVTLRRGDPDRVSSLRCVFVTLPAFPGGVELAQRRELKGGRGFVEKSLGATPADRLPAALPELGPDLELTWEMADGKPLPADLRLLHQVRFPKQPGLEPRSNKHKLAGTRWALRFPELQLDVEHLYAVFSKQPRPLRTHNPLRITTETLGGVNAKNPPRIKHTFVLEPVPGQ